MLHRVGWLYGRAGTIARYHPDGGIVDTIGTFWLQATGFLNRELRYVGGPIFGARAAFAYYPGDTLAYGSGRTEQVELWTTDGDLRRIVRWSARDRQVSREDAVEWKRRFRERFAGDLSSPHAQVGLEAQVGDHRPIADVFPSHEAWGRLLASREGSLWINEFRRPLDEGADRWLVFHPRGDFACQLSVPDDLTLLEAGHDYILALERDDFGVEYVVQRAVQPPVSTEGS